MGDEPRELMDRIWNEFTSGPIKRADLDSGRLARVARQYYAADVEWRSVEGWVGQEIYSGHAGLLQFWTEWFSTFDEVTMDVEHIEVRGSVVASIFVQTGSASGGMHVPWRLGVINVFRDGLVQRVELSRDVDAMMHRLEELAASEVSGEAAVAATEDRAEEPPLET